MLKRLLPLVVPVLLLLSLPAAAQAKPSEHPFELAPGSFHFTPSNLTAGAHADWVTAFDFAHEANGQTDGDLRDVSVNIPTGFDASDTAVPTCTQQQLLTESADTIGANGAPSCPLASQVGQISFEVSVGATDGLPVEVTDPVYNMQPTNFGTVAELGYVTAYFGGYLSVRIRPKDLGLTVTSTDIVPITEPHNVKVTIWGVPAAAEHNALRGAECVRQGDEAEPACHQYGGVPQPAGIPVKPYLSNPTSCGMFEASMKADSWEESGRWSEASDPVGPIAQCGRIPFEPSIEVQPSTRSAESPSGLAVSLLVPQEWENPITPSTSYLADTKLTLPEGMTANPSLAAGLGSCTPSQYEAETSSSLPGAGCPEESKIGSIEIETPLLDEKVDGAVYIATPYDNLPEFGESGHPGGSLLALYVVAKDPQRGVLVKVAGKITPNPVTGQLVTTFENTPQQPFNRFTLKFRPGSTAPLSSPPACGTYTSEGELTPWSAPSESRFLSSSFAITDGVHEGACPSGGIPPWHPQVISGTENNAGGTYSPFYLRILREDGEQEITRFSTTLPPGLTGNLSGIPFCPEADIEAAKNVTGAEEEEHPSCPAASEVGHTLVGAGVGPVLAENPGKVYLAGPYDGAPLSIVSITSAKVGPFDLGTVVIRFALNINPSTAQVEVSGARSEAIPRILRGIVVHVREIRVYMDREKFTINPTNCSPLSITDTIDGAGANPTNPADQVPVTVGTPFEAADCSSLKFTPKFTASTEAKDHFNGNGASLKVNLSANQGPSPTTGQGSESNISKVKVELPIALPSRLTTLQKACLAKVFESNPANCPPDSFIGSATVHTPILPVPLTGPAIFVSHGGEAFPSLILVLQGYGVTIDLTGATFISKSGITSSTFKTVPDQPFSTFELTLPTGKFSALAAITNVCKPVKTETVKKKVKVKVSKTVAGKRVTTTKTVTKKVSEAVAAPLLMPTEMVAQNGAVLKQSTKIAVTGCKAAKPAKKAKKSKKKAKGKKK
jgi:hypothetical protein